MWKHALSLAQVCLWAACAHAGGAEQMVSRPGVEDMRPAWSADSQYLACITKTSAGPRVCTMRADGKERKVLPEPEGNVVSVVWSAKGRRLAVVTQQEDKRELWIVSERGGKARRVGKGREPAFSPDSRWLAYATDTAIVLLGLTGGSAAARVQGSANRGFMNPSWTPDSRRLVYSSDGSLWQVPSALNGIRKAARPFLRRQRYPYRKAIFSRDGKRALIVGDSSVATGEQAGDPLWVTDANGRNARRIPAGYAPSWTSDPEWPVVCARSGAIVLLSADGRRRQTLTQGKAPAVSPSGARLAFERRIEEGEADDLFGATKRSKVFVRPMPSRVFASPGRPAPSSGPDPRWSIRIPAAVDMGLRDRTDPVARAMIDLSVEAKKAGTSARPSPRSLRAYVKRQGRWVEAPSSARPDAADRNLIDAAWLLRGKHDMLEERECLLCFHPAGAQSVWRRPVEWLKLAPPRKRRNLAPNGSVETADPRDRSRPKSWRPSRPKNSEASVDTGSPYHGKRCLKLAASHRMATPQWISAQFPLKANTDYMTSYAVRSELKQGIPAVVWLYYFDRRRKGLKGAMVRRRRLAFPVASSKWQVGRAKVRPPQGTAYGQIRVGLWRTVGTFYLDQFAVEPFVREDAAQVTLGRMEVVR